MDQGEISHLIAYIKGFLKRVHAQEAFLFGSRVRGDNLLESDVDLIVVSEDFARVEFPHRLIFLHSHWDLPYFLEALAYTPEELSRLAKTRGVIAEALKSGIRITPNQE